MEVKQKIGDFALVLGAVTGAPNIVPDPEVPLELAAASVVVVWLIVRELKVGHQQKSRRIYQRDYLVAI